MSLPCGSAGKESTFNEGDLDSITGLGRSPVEGVGSVQFSRSVESDSLRPHVLYSPWNSGILEWVAFPSPGDLPKSGINPRSPALHVDSLPAESQWKPKNTGVCSLSLLQGIFLTQESNWGLPHSRRILYQLSYQRSPISLQGSHYCDLHFKDRGS